MKNTVLNGVSSLLVVLIIFLTTLGSAFLIYYFEDWVFGLINYRWGGVGDVFFWIFAFLESFFGLRLALYDLPAKMGVISNRNIYSYNYTGKLNRYILAILIGFPMGLAFSGVWKLLLLAFHIMRGN